METNLLRAIDNISKLDTFALTELYNGANRINNIGTALEYFVRDVFCSSLDVKGLDAKDREHSRHLSYLGNQNNPPDFIIKGGDAVEVKKIVGLVRDIPLNSSYPKAKLYKDDTRISAACRDSDGGKWGEKDNLYVVGSVVSAKIRVLWFVYGDCYAADRKVYERISDKISKGIHAIDDIEFSETNEIAGVKRVDPLGITYLRVRGMWGIETPHKVFGGLTRLQASDVFASYALLTEEKYKSFPSADRKRVEANRSIIIERVKIKSPNNPARYLDARLISFTK